METQFTNRLDPEPRSRRLFHQPETLAEWLDPEHRLGGPVGGTPRPLCTLPTLNRAPIPLMLDVVVAEGGTNTVVDGTPGIGAVAWGQMVPAVDAARAASSKVVLCTIPPRSTGPAYSPGVQAGVDDYNVLARAYAAAHPGVVVLVDLYFSHGEPGTPTRLRVTYDAGDGLHMTQAGQDRWACDTAQAIIPGAVCS